VRIALNEGAFVDCKDKYGNTPLLFAAARGRVSVIRELLKCGADIDLAAPGGMTALHAAAKWGKARAVEELLRRGADATNMDHQRRTAGDVAAAIVAQDSDRCPAGVHPKPSEEEEPPPSRPAGGDDDELDAEEAENDRRRASEAKARAAALYSTKLTPHEQVLQVLEDWVIAAEEAAAAELQKKKEEEEEEEEDDEEAAIEEIRVKIVALSTVVEAQANVVAVEEAVEAEHLAAARKVTKEIKAIEAGLSVLSASLETAQVAVTGAREKRLLAAYELAKAKLDRVEKEVEVARLEGRPEVKDELEALIPTLRAAKKKAQAECKHLLKVQARGRKGKKQRGQQQQQQQQQPGGSRDNGLGSPLSPGSPLQSPAIGGLDDDNASVGSVRSVGSFVELNLGSSVTSLGSDMDSVGDGGSSIVSSGGGAFPARRPQAMPLEEGMAFELPDPYSGTVPVKLKLTDDGWRAVDQLQSQIDRLRAQLRFLGERPHC